MKSLTSLFLTTSLLFTCSHSFAASINERQAKQEERIAKGIISGELNRRETTNLVLQQRDIARKEERFRSDGTLTRRERANLHYSLNKSSNHIYNKKHNNRGRH